MEGCVHEFSTGWIVRQARRSNRNNNCRKKPTTRIVRQRLGLASIGREGHARFEEDDQRDVVARQATFPENSSGSLPLAVTFQRNRPWNRESDQIRRFISGILRQPS